MRIKVLRNLGYGLPDYTEGQVVDVEQELGESLCQRGLAEQIIQAVPQSPLKAVPPVPEIGSVEQAEADLKTYRNKQKGRKPTFVREN